MPTFRGYDSSHGRWLNRDPIEERGGINLYEYANANPSSYMDPTGNHPIGAAGIAMGMLAGALGSIAAQLIQNQGNANCIDWTNVGWSAITGGVAGFVLTTSIGLTWTGAMGTGALSNVANYAVTTSPDSYSATGFGYAAISGLAGGIIGGTTPNPSIFRTWISPNLFSPKLSAQILSLTGLANNFIGGVGGGYDYTKSPQNFDECGCAK
jgi:uncharacterized protein RhaS with RHS repeats